MLSIFVAIITFTCTACITGDFLNSAEVNTTVMQLYMHQD